MSDVLENHCRRITMQDPVLSTAESLPSLGFDERHVMIDSRLEARVSTKAPMVTGWCAVLTHPHPKLGGDMGNNVVIALKQALNDIGIATLRFNTRGVGRSQGSSSWTGVNEREDIRAAVEHANALSGVKKVVLVAYSFGAAVGWSISADLAKEKKIQAIVAVGYPKGFFAQFIFWQHYSRIDPKSDIPKLFVLGDSDNFTSVSTIQGIVNKVSEPKELVILKHADHFCFDEEEKITQPVVEFMRNEVLQASNVNSNPVRIVAKSTTMSTM